MKILTQAETFCYRFGGEVRDPLLDLLEGPTFGRPAPPAPEATKAKPTPIPGIPEGWERYYKHISSQPDRTSSAHLVMPTSMVDHYREYDRSPDDPNAKVLERTIREHGGIRQPLVISADDHQGVLTEGNHRLAIAKKLGIDSLPVRVQYGPRAQPNEGVAVDHHPDFKAWLDNNKSRLGSSE